MSKKNACRFCLKTPAMYPGISLHSFPSDTKIRELWLTACGFRDGDFKQNLKLCSLHFEESNFKSGSVRRTLKPGSIPTKLSSRTKSFFQSGTFCNLSSANSMEVQLDDQVASTSNGTKNSFESGSFSNLSNANSMEVQLDDHDASTSTNIEVSSTEVCNTEMIEDPIIITPKRKRSKYYIGDIKTPDLSTPRRAKFHFNDAKLKILRSRKRIKVLNQNVNRLKIILSSMADLFAHLKSKNLIIEEAHDTILNTTNDSISLSSSVSSSLKFCEQLNVLKEL